MKTKRKFTESKDQKDYEASNTVYNNLLLEHGSLKQAKNELAKLFKNREIFSTPKPEKLMYELINLGTSRGDIVMDFHLGSGTTAAVAHKMERQYIGIEQINYISDVAAPRMIEIIKGEQGGISKDSWLERRRRFYIHRAGRI
jgi:adenine-specific DNA-methyltransferase